MNTEQMRRPSLHAAPAQYPAHRPAGTGGHDGGDTLPLVRANVKDLLTRSKAFQTLSDDKRRQLAQDLVTVSRYMVDACGETRDVPVTAIISRDDDGSQPGARALAEGDQPSPDTAGADFEAQGGAVAADAGVGALGEAVTKVNFPGFVSGLIEGVFSAIVQASIEQMEAYGTLLQNVAKTADQYMKDNVTEDQARDYLVESYPDHLEADMSGEQGRVVPRRDADTESMPDFMRDLGLPFPIDDLDDDIVEEELVPAARKRMAIDRQQLLLTLVLMGINRIVVTDGKISASVVFTLNTTDLVTQHKERTKTFEYNSSRYRPGRRGFLWFKPKTRFTSETKLNVETAQDEDSEAKVDLKVKLKGNVDLRFKSETFPLEKVADIIGVDRGDLEAKKQTQAQERRASAPMAPPVAPPLPPLPTP